jgi:hypothetical protein
MMLDFSLPRTGYEWDEDALYSFDGTLPNFKVRKPPQAKK